MQRQSRILKGYRCVSGPLPNFHRIYFSIYPASCKYIFLFFQYDFIYFDRQNLLLLHRSFYETPTSRRFPSDAGSVSSCGKRTSQELNISPLFSLTSFWYSNSNKGKGHTRRARFRNKLPPSFSFFLSSFLVAKTAAYAAVFVLSPYLMVFCTK